MHAVGVVGDGDRASGGDGTAAHRAGRGAHLAHGRCGDEDGVGREVRRARVLEDMMMMDAVADCARHVTHDDDET